MCSDKTVRLSPLVQTKRLRQIAAWLVSFLCLLPVQGTAWFFSSDRLAASGVVKIYVAVQRQNYAMPWQGGEREGGTASGFIISKKRILTNAHVVSDAKYIEIQKADDAKRYEARIKFIAHDCDMAMLSVDDETFFQNTEPVTLAEDMPILNDEVLVLGFPMGGDRLSITKGVVSRKDYSVYTHSGIDQHLVLQVDAAINPGNSGGPVFFKGKVVGLAFQGLMAADNIGYAIPMPVIRHFLKDVEDGKYDGYPELGIDFLTARNAALRKDLGLSESSSGIVVTYVDPFASGKDYLHDRDVLLAIDSHPIDDDGSVRLGEDTMLFAELIERKQWGESIRLRIWRDKAEKEIDVPLKNPRDPFIYRNLYDAKARFVISGGLVFAPLNREYLQAASGHGASINAHQLIYYATYAKIDELYRGRDEFIVLTARLPHPVNTYADTFVNGIVTEINGIPIRNLRSVKSAMEKPSGAFQVIKFAGMDDSLVMDAKAVSRADPEIFMRYAIARKENFEE